MRVNTLIIPLNKNLEIPQKVPLENDYIVCLRGRDLGGGRQGWEETFVLCTYVIYVEMNQIKVENNLETKAKHSVARS